MTTTTDHTTPWGTGQTVELHAGTATLTVALAGATPLQWLLQLGEHSWDALDGYRDPAELDAQDGVRNGVMAPFCNRVAGATYTFDGAEHDLRPGSGSDDRVIYHGLVRTLSFTVVEQSEGDQQSSVTLRCDALTAGDTPGYPFKVSVDVTYVLTPHALHVEIAGTNQGADVAPFAAGWHPYFRLPGHTTIDRLSLEIPSTYAVQADDLLHPLDGDAAFEQHEGVHWEPIGDRVVDQAFGGFDASGSPIRTVLRDATTGVALTLNQDRGLVHVFTADPLARGQRQSIAVEPVEVMTNAFNRDDCAQEIRLQPQDKRSFVFDVELSQTGAVS